jgi:hypothetical protein
LDISIISSTVAIGSLIIILFMHAAEKRRRRFEAQILRALREQVHPSFSNVVNMCDHRTPVSASVHEDRYPA